jgi:2-polyprenyl-3-methyl-5-hydroxy-6-metoxy-1,4-benzoquinol methylase
MNERPDSDSWLRANRDLRMDANHPMFPPERRQFHLDRYAFARGYCAGKTVLDGACGAGYGSALLGERAARVVGIDMSGESVAYATRDYGRDNVSFRKSFVELTPFDDNSFDVIVSFETVEHTLCPRSHMMEVARLLEPEGGVAIVSVPNQWGLTAQHFFDFDLAFLREVTRPFFSKVEYFRQNPRSRHAHGGIAPLVSQNPADAQCIIAVCREPRKENLPPDRHEFVREETYQVAFARHTDYLRASHRDNLSLGERAVVRLRAIASLLSTGGRTRLLNRILSRSSRWA